MNNYFQGNLIRARAQFENASNILTDPSIITTRVLTPAGVEHIYVYGVDVELVRESTGIYHVDINANLAGVWDYRFEGTGTVTAASQDKFLCIAAKPA